MNCIPSSEGVPRGLGAEMVPSQRPANVTYCVTLVSGAWALRKRVPIQIWAPPLTGCVALGELHNLSVLLT